MDENAGGVPVSISAKSISTYETSYLRVFYGIVGGVSNLYSNPNVCPLSVGRDRKDFFLICGYKY